MKTAWLARLIMKHIPPSRKPDFLIGPSADNPYMRRWWLIPRNRLFNVYLHHVLHDDDDRALHDHPWPSLSLNLTGGISEMYVSRWNSDGTPAGTDVKHFRQGEWRWRGPTFAHRLFLTTWPDEMDNDFLARKDAWTLFMTGPVIRKWGFWCPQSWRYWRDFVNSRDTGRIGRGCE